MNEMIEKPGFRRFLRFVWHAVPEMLQFQIITKVLLALSLYGLKALTGVLLRGGGFAVITASDIVKLVRTWQGWLLILLFLFIMFLYTAAEILAQIINSDNIMYGRRMKIRDVYLKGFLGLKAFVSGGGIPLIVFITFAVPLTGIGYTISLTRNFRLPNFITSVILSTPHLLIIYIAGIFAALVFSVMNTYTFPAAVLDGLTVKNAKRRSKRLIFGHKKDLLQWFVPLFGIYFALAFAIDFSSELIPAFFALRIGDTSRTAHLLVLFAGFFGNILQFILNMLSTAVLLLLVTVLYRLYTQKQVQLKEEKQEPLKLKARFPVAGILILCVAGSIAMEFFYSDLLSFGSPAIIAHRGGGDLAAENSLEGMLAAISAEAYGSEFDVQRTKDGFYIINHDSTFGRLCGDSRRSRDITLEEIRRLEIRDHQYGEDYRAKVPTLEEVLDTVGDREVLFIELKGETADYRMADDVAGMVMERNLEGSCVIISLKRNLISYLELTYPELNTGLIYYLSYGPAEEIVADLLIMEEKLADFDTIRRVHESGKTAVVWTVNTKSSMDRFLDSEADAVITDHVEMAQQIRSELSAENDIGKIQKRLKRLFDLEE